MNVEPHDLFEQHYVAHCEGEECRGLSPVHRDDVQIEMIKDVPIALAERQAQGYKVIGSSEFVGRGSLGVGLEARTQASKVNASLVLFRMAPAKFKAIRRLPCGAIDWDAAVADPPAHLSPKGHFVVKAYFLAQPPR